MKSLYHQNRKSQTIIDLAFAILLFLFIFFFFSTFYYSSLEKYNYELVQDKLDFYSKTFCNNLINSEGNPKDWDNDFSNVKSIGLLNSSKKVDANKFFLFIQNNSQIISNLNQLNYDIRLKVLNLNTNQIYFDNTLSSVKRIIITTNTCFLDYNGELILFLVEVF